MVATFCDLTTWDAAADEVPIGHAIPNAWTCLLNRRLEPATEAADAELFVGGAGLARGYLNDPALTAERFVPDPVSGRPGSRLYRTGDVARLRPGGVLEFAGRLDDQVKLRGYRIEPGEIESMLVQHASLREAAVVVREDHPGDRRLVAYLVPFDPSSSIGQIREFLQERLPGYMVPSAFVMLETLPRTIQRKVDRAALPAPIDEAQQGPEPDAPPRTEIERKIVAIWSELLHRDRIGVLENFFDLGGHSLLVIQLHARLCEAFGDDLSLVDLFRFPTVQSQAAQLTQRVDEAPTLDAVRDRASRQRQAFSAPRHVRPAGTVVE